MSRVERSALIRQDASRMFALVNEVGDYPRRFDWCSAARVLERDASSMLARLDLKVAGMALGFTTRNRWQDARRIELTLVEGPFRRLAGAWSFDPLAEDACKVSLRLDFEVAGRLVGSALARGFRGLADRLVDDFVRAAAREAPQPIDG